MSSMGRYGDVQETEGTNGRDFWDLRRQGWARHLQSWKVGRRRIRWCLFPLHQRQRHGSYSLSISMVTKDVRPDDHRRVFAIIVWTLVVVTDVTGMLSFSHGEIVSWVWVICYAASIFQVYCACMWNYTRDFAPPQFGMLRVNWCIQACKVLALAKFSDFSTPVPTWATAMARIVVSLVMLTTMTGLEIRRPLGQGGVRQ